jgi:hypothetical protein
VGALLPALLTPGGLFSRQLRELRETRYQFEQPFLLDSTVCTATFSITATPLDEGLGPVAEYADRATVESTIPVG